MNVVTQLTQFVGRDVINKNMTDLAVRYSTGSVELSWVQLSCVALAMAYVNCETYSFDISHCETSQVKSCNQKYN